MGYTHYWYKEPILSQKNWFDFANDFVKVLPHFYKELDSTTDQKFYINSDELFLNGVGEDGWDKAKELCQDILKYGETFDISYETQNKYNGGQFI